MNQLSFGTSGVTFFSGHDVECGPKMTEIVKTQSLKTAVDPSCKSSKK